MKLSHPLGISAHDSDPDPEEILARYDAFIVALARKHVPYNVTHPQDMDDEVAELAQAVRFKLWRALQREPLTHPKSYIWNIVHNEAIDMARRQQRRPTSPLPVDDDGELYQIVLPGEDSLDPLCRLEQEETATECLNEIVDQVLTLPAVQQQAMICSLKDKVEDLLLLVKAFKDHGVDIEAVHWPLDKNERRSLRTSLSIARKKLHALQSTCGKMTNRYNQV